MLSPTMSTVDQQRFDDTIPMGDHVAPNTPGATVSLKPSHTWTFHLSLGTYTAGTHVIVFEESFDGGTVFSDIAIENLDGKDLAGHVQQLELSGSTPTNTVTYNDGTKDNTTIQVAYLGGAGNVRARREDAVGAALYHVTIAQTDLRNSGKNAMLDNWDAPNVG